MYDDRIMHSDVKWIYIHCKLKHACMACMKLIKATQTKPKLMGGSWTKSTDYWSIIQSRNDANAENVENEAHGQACRKRNMIMRMKSEKMLHLFG